MSQAIDTDLCIICLTNVISDAKFKLKRICKVLHVAAQRGVVGMSLTHWGNLRLSLIN